MVGWWCADFVVGFLLHLCWVLVVMCFVFVFPLLHAVVCLCILVWLCIGCNGCLLCVASIRARLGAGLIADVGTRQFIVLTGSVDLRLVKLWVGQLYGDPQNDHLVIVILVSEAGGGAVGFVVGFIVMVVSLVVYGV